MRKELIGYWTREQHFEKSQLDGESGKGLQKHFLNNAKKRLIDMFFSEHLDDIFDYDKHLYHFMFSKKKVTSNNPNLVGLHVRLEVFKFIADISLTDIPYEITQGARTRQNEEKVTESDL